MDGSRAVLVVALLSAVALAGCSASGEPINEAGPAWQSGYAWSFAWESKGEWVEHETGDERHNDTWDESGRMAVEVLNTSLDFAGVPVYVVGVMSQEGDDGWRDLAFVRQRDLATLEAEWDVTVACAQTECDVSYGEFDVDAEGAPTFLDFPLRNGKTWSSVEEQWGLELVLRGSVAGRAMVDTPLGQIEAIRIDFVRVPVNLQELINEAKAEAAEEGYRLDRFDVRMEERSTIYYSPDYQMSVRVDHHYKESFHVSGKDDEGERFEFQESSRSDYRRVIDGARLVARAERTMDDAAAFVEGRLPITDPTGKGVGSGGYKIDVVPEVDRVNAADGAAARFTVAFDGVESLPANHSVVWTVLDYDDGVVAEGEGLTFEPAPSTPGQYTVVAEALDADGAAVASAGAPLVADYIGSVTLACGPVSAFFTGDCPTHELPIHPGIQMATVTATPTSPATSPFFNGFHIEDPDGEEARGERSGNSWSVTVKNFREYEVDDAPWQAVFRQSVGVADDVELSITLLYGDASGLAVPAETGWDAPGWLGTQERRQILL